MYIQFTDDEVTPRPGAQINNNNIDVNTAISIAGTKVFAKNCYITGIAGPIIGIGFNKNTSYDQSLSAIQNNETQLTTGAYLRAGLGYKGKKWFYGADAFNEQYGSGKEGERTTRHFFGYKIFIGFRFNTPKSIKKMVDLIPISDI
jgi:hypothetical protein